MYIFALTRIFSRVAGVAWVLSTHTRGAEHEELPEIRVQAELPVAYNFEYECGDHGDGRLHAAA